MPFAHTETLRGLKRLCIGKGELGTPQQRSYPFILTRYVQMLERQQSQLIAGIQLMYRSMQKGEGWTGPPLDHDAYGQPLTHKVLEGLGILVSEKWDDIMALDKCLNPEESPSAGGVVDLISELSSISFPDRQQLPAQSTLTDRQPSGATTPFPLILA